MDQVRKYITQATKQTAISAAKLIKDQGFTPQDILTEEESLKREKLIDQAGVDAMSQALQDIPFTLEIVGSEGRKHIHQYGEALPTLMGTFGPANAKLKLDMVNDVVEGSKAAKLNSSGAVSVIAVSSHKGLMSTPFDTDYMDKLFGPPQLKGKVSLKKSIEENLSIAVDTFKIKPQEINVVMMDRDRNAHYIDACQKFGANITRIPGGDFLPAILSCINPKDHNKGVHLLIGSGGFEEGVMSVVAAKALGAVGEGKGWSGDLRIQKKYEKAWTTDEIIKGKKEDCLVSISTITKEDKWFNLSPLSTLTVDSSGVKIKRP